MAALHPWAAIPWLCARSGLEGGLHLVPDLVLQVPASFGELPVRMKLSLLRAMCDALLQTDGFKEVLDGKHDELPEQAFFMVGTIEEAVETAKKELEGLNKVLKEIQAKKEAEMVQKIIEKVVALVVYRRHHVVGMVALLGMGDPLA